MRKITNQELNRPSVEEFAQMSRIPVVVVLDNVRSAQNVGAFFRTGDAFAIERVALCGITATPPSKDIHKSALGAEMTVEWSYYSSTIECGEQLKADGYQLLAIEQVEGAVMLDKLQVDASAKYALVFGNEVAGVEQGVVDLCDGAIEIPQIGTKHSLNVSVAGGVVLWPFFVKLKELVHQK
jgi:tRNA G18 (ribose-2'-O)-methylase SpoU